MVGEQWWAWEEISTQTQQLELRLVYLWTLVMRNWIWKGRKKICPWNSPPADNFSGNPLSYEKFELKKRKKEKRKKRKSAYYNFFFYDWTTINPQATVQTRCFWSISPLPTRRKLHQGREWTPQPLLRYQETEGAITAERRRQLEQASQGGWQQQSLVSPPEVQGVKGLALKKSLKENSWQWARSTNHGTLKSPVFQSTYLKSDTINTLFIEGLVLIFTN